MPGTEAENQEAVWEALREHRASVVAEVRRHDITERESRRALAVLLARGETAGLDRAAMSEAAVPSWSYTTHLTVVEAIAKRDAEALGHRVACAHLLAAIVWEGDGIGAHVLSEFGIEKGGLSELRERIAATPDLGRGIDLQAIDGAAFAFALEFGDQHIGEEHVMLAILDDSSLSESLLPAERRAPARERVREIIAQNRTVSDA